MRLLWFLATCAVCVVAVPSTVPDNNGKIRYDNCKVYKLKIQNKSQLDILSKLENQREKYNIWRNYDEVEKDMDIMVKPDEDEHFLNLLKEHDVAAEVKVSNVQDLIDRELKTNVLTRHKAEFNWTSYHTLPEIEQWLDDILNKYPKVTKGFEIGKSFENRTIRGIKISHKPGKPVIFIESTIHSWEWITTATITWFINELLTSTKPEVRNLANSYDWYIIPVFNVDGFVYTHEKDRLWRKTRQPVAHSTCIGTDANRNFDSHWMENNGASDDPCHRNYAGTAPLSEPEVKNLVKYLKRLKNKIKIYLALHSYGQYLLSPYGNSTTEFPPNYDDLNEIGKSFVTAIGNLEYKTKYQSGSFATVLYVGSGTSVDWVYNDLGVKVSYTVEFRDKGLYGFLLPPEQILPNCEEFMAGLLALVGKSKELGYVK